MHRLIMNAQKGQISDHVNRIKLDNRRSNLRLCTRSENNCNKPPLKGKTSKYKGVYWEEARRKWRVRIMLNGKRYHLGHFDDEKDAAQSYNTKARELFGEFARLNEIN